MSELPIAVTGVHFSEESEGKPHLLSKVIPAGYEQVLPELFPPHAGFSQVAGP